MRSEAPIEILSPLDIRTADGNRVELFSDNPELSGFAKYSSLTASRSISLHHYAGEGFNIWYSRYKMKEQTTFIARADIPVLELHIPLEKYFTTTWDGYYQTLPYEKQYDLSFAPFINTTSSLRSAIEYGTFDIHYDFAYLQHFDGHPLLSAFLEQVIKKQAANLIGDTRFITPAMLEIIQQILHFHLDPGLAPFFYEAQAQLLLVLILDGLWRVTHPLILTPQDKEAILHAKDIIDHDLTRIYTIRQMSRLIGINVSKLQLHFKQLFGTTIFDYHQNLRLEQARNMLLDTKLPVHSIALNCGYSDNANLTTAFKKKYGYTPESFRKKLK